MSISTLQERFFNKGCGTVIIGLAAVAMVASMFTRFGGSSSGGANGEGSSGAVVTVGNVPIPAALIQETSSQLQARLAPPGSPSSTPTLDASTQAQVLASATGQVLQRAAVQALLSKEPPTDAEIQAFATAQIEARIAGSRAALEKQGKLKAGASDADLEKALKDVLQGKTLAQIRKEAPANLLKQFKDPTTKSAVLDEIGGALLAQRLGEKAVGSDQALRDSYKTYLVRRVFLSSVSGSKDSPEVRAQKAEAELKAGKPFGDVMDEMSNDPAPPGKKVHDLIDTVPATALDSRPELASLQGKAAGATTGVVDTAGGKAIYQISSVQPNLPPDFEKNKAQLRATQIQSIGQAQAEKQVKALLAGSEVKWQSPGYQALAVTGQALQSMGNMALIFDPAAAKAAFAAGQAALKSDNPVDRRLGAQALLVATDPKVLAVKSSDIDANRRIALEAAQAAGIEDATLSLALAGLHGDAKDGAKATATLIAASKANDRFDAEGERLFREIAAKALELQKKGVLTKEQLQSVQAQQALWTASRTNNSKAATQAKSDEASVRAANEAEIARQKAEAAKSTPPASGGATSAENAAEIARQKAEAASSTPSKPSAAAAPAPGKGR